MTDLEIDLTAVSSRSLCRCYALAVPEATSVRVRDPDGVREHPLFWVFGWLADGECEALGLCLGAPALAPMLAGFKRRGLERIWHVEPLMDGATQEAQVAMLAIDHSFPGALESSQPSFLATAMITASEIRDELARTVRRHGHFENQPAALDFFALALHRAEHRLDRERQSAKERPRDESGAQSGTLAN